MLILLVELLQVIQVSLLYNSYSANLDTIAR